MTSFFVWPWLFPTWPLNLCYLCARWGRNAFGILFFNLKSKMTLDSSLKHNISDYNIKVHQEKCMIYILISFVRGVIKWSLTCMHLRSATTNSSWIKTTPLFVSLFGFFMSLTMINCRWRVSKSNSELCSRSHHCVNT